VLLVHGSASDHTTWQIQLASPLRERFTLIAYDRRADATSVEQHAADAAEVLAGQRALIVGSSFGAVVSLELMRTRPELCAGAILIEPPMAASDEAPAAPAQFMAEFDRIAAEQGGPAAGEFFCRAVLGTVTWDNVPLAFQERSKAKWAEIRADSAALIAYKPRYAELASVKMPVLLLGGASSAAYFRPTLEALQAALPHARLEIVKGAGHMLHVEARTTFADLLVAFAEQIQIE
jgi:pimeloyl-ACP methyl ester carboxylesterase